MRHIISIAIVLSASACTSIEPLRPDMEARPLPSRLDEIAYINGLRSAYVRINSITTDSNQSSVDCYAGKDLKIFRPKFVQGYRTTDEKAEHLNSDSCVLFGSPKGKEPAIRVAIQDYLDNGYGLADLYCSRFMIIAAETRQSRQIQKSTFNAVNAMVSTVLNAVAGASKNAMNIATGGFTLIDSTYKNIDDAFVITPEKDTLVRLVQAAQSAFREQAKDKPPRSYADARSRLERYSSICSYDGMKGMVNTSILLASQSLVEEQKKPKAAQTESIQKTGAGAVADESSTTPTTNAMIPPL